MLAGNHDKKDLSGRVIIGMIGSLGLNPSTDEPKEVLAAWR